MPKEGTQDTSATKPDVEKQDEKSVDLSSMFGDSQDDEDTSEKTDVKPDKSSSSEAAEEPDTETLKAQLDALTKELNRVRKSKTESSNEVQDLRDQLSNVQGQLEVLAKGADKSGDSENKLAKYTDDQLLQGQTEWEDSLADARDAMRRARADNDESAYGRASKEQGVARSTLNAIRKELLERSKRVGAEQAKAQTEASELVQEVVSMYDQAYESFPGLKDRDSDIWKAGNEAYTQHPKLMKQLGPLAELVAVAMAITTKPDLTSGKEADGKRAATARKELLTEINERAEKSLIKGGGTTKQKTVPDFQNMPADQFDAVVHKIKMGS